MERMTLIRICAKIIVGEKVFQILDLKFQILDLRSQNSNVKTQIYNSNPKIYKVIRF